MQMKADRKDMFTTVFSYAFIALFALFCVYPLLLTLGVSFSDEHTVQIHGYKLIPEKFSLDSYIYLLNSSGSRILGSYWVTIIVTAGGTLFAMLVTSMMAFAMSMKSLRYRNAIAMYSYFTVIFSAGMVPWYLVCVNILHLKDSIVGLTLPYAVNVWNLFLLRNFFSDIPESIFESAKIDGAGNFLVYRTIGLPLAKTAVLTVSLFYALQFWNDWWLAIMLIEKQNLYPLQYYLFSIISNVQALTSGIHGGVASHITLPSETVKMTVTIITIGPVIFLYPFIQRYFVKGIIVGGVKG